MSIQARFNVKWPGFVLDVSLDISMNAVTSIFGPTGCGKTTILRAIAGLDHHKDGYLNINGEVWQKNNIFKAAHERSIGYVFQEASLFDHLNVRQNLEFGFSRIAKANQKFTIQEIINLLKINHLEKRSTISLSGGERQRIAIARSLLVSPQILLMDEPIAALDQNSKLEVLQSLERLKTRLNIPIIYISHSQNEIARLADTIILLENGRVLATGSTNDIFTRSDLPLAHSSDATSVIDAEVVEIDEKFQMARIKFDGGQLTIAGCELATGKKVRVTFAARDVSITLEQQTNTSILNIIQATITHISNDSKTEVTVHLLAGDTAILSRITKKSAQTLDLKTGDKVFAQIKSVVLLA